MHALLPPPPPPSKERRAPTTGASIVLAGIALASWFIANIALGGLQVFYLFFEFDRRSAGSQLGNGRWIASMVAVVMLVIAGCIYLAPRVQRS